MTIRIGTTGDYPPFSYYESKFDLFIGCDIDIMHQIAILLGKIPIFVKTTWQNMHTDLLSNKFDVFAGGACLTLNRSKLFLLSRPHISNGKIPIIHRDNINLFTNLQKIDRAENTVVTNQGGTNEVFAINNIKNAAIIYCNNMDTIFEMLIEKKVDAFITDRQEACYRLNILPALTSVNINPPLSNESIGFLISPDKKQLHEKINHALHILIENNRIGTIHNKWQLNGTVPM